MQQNYSIMKILSLIVWTKITFLNDTFQSYHDLLQVNWLVQT